MLGIVTFSSGCESPLPPDDAGGPDEGRAEFLAPCTAPRDCVSGLCLELSGGDALCTRSCVDDSGCPDAENWGCITAEAGENVCGCVPDSASEICGDGRDNDCDGVADDCIECGGRECAPGFECVDEECVCGEGRDACGRACADFRTDSEHCGACDNRCAAGTSCALGRCVCPGGGVRCGDVCVDVSSDGMHCGGCDNSCAGGQVCLDGACRCPGAGIVCGSRCVDPQSDDTNCGGCGIACGESATCVDGVCACDGGGVLCEGTCIDVRSDDLNCGACGRVCSTSGSSCVDGACTCPAGTEACDRRCRDLSVRSRVAHPFTKRGATRTPR